MTARDLDLVLGGVAIAVAGVLARLAEPAVAISILAVLLAAFIGWLGDERIEALWRAYCAEPAPRARRRPTERSPGRPLPPPRVDRRASATLPRARVVSPR